MSSELSDFQNYQLHQRIRDFWRDNLTGSLHLDLQGFEKALFFRDGQLVFATSKDPRDKLPQIFIQQGRFTEAQFEAVQPNFRADLSVGRNLVEMGLITQNELVEGAKLQIYHIFSHSMAAESGKIGEELGSLPQGIVNLPLKFPADIARSIAAIPQKDWFSLWLGTANRFTVERVAGPSGEFHKLGLSEFADEVYKAIEHRVDFNHLAFEVDADDFSLIKFLYTLDLLGMVEVDRLEEDDSADPFASTAEESGAFAHTSEIPGIDPQRLRNEFAMQARFEDQLNQFGKMSMDETVELSGFNGDASSLGLPSLDATTEISRNVLRDSDPFGEDQDSFGGDETFEMKRVTEGTFARDIGIGEDSEEQLGLDDLSSDSFERHLEHLERQRLPVDESHKADDADDSSFEEEDEAPKRRFSLKGLFAKLGEKFRIPRLPRPSVPEVLIRRRRLLLWLTGSGLMLTAASYTAAMNWPAVRQYWLDLASLSATKASKAPEAEKPAELAKQAEPPKAAENKPAPTAQSTTEPEGSTIPEEPMASAPAASGRLENGIALPARGFHSPVADEWDPKRNLPKTVSAQVNINEKQQDPPPQAAEQSAKVLPVKTNAETASGGPPGKPALPTAVQADPIAPPKAKDPRPPVQVVDDRALLLAGKFKDAAEAKHQSLLPKKTLEVAVLFSSCQATEIQTALEIRDARDKLFLLPKRGAPGCFWICWGEPGKRIPLLSSLKDVPQEIGEAQLQAGQIRQVMHLKELL